MQELPYAHYLRETVADSAPRYSCARMKFSAEMAIPSFGFPKIEALACILMVAAGLAGLILVLTGSSDWTLRAFGGKWGCYAN